MRAIDLLVIAHDEHRPEAGVTLGDWYFDNAGCLVVKVSDTGTMVYNHALMLHELVEAILCTYAGVTPGMVDQFDRTFDGDGEPGDDPAAPYHREHLAAEIIERAFLFVAGYDWAAYGAACERVMNAKT